VVSRQGSEDTVPELSTGVREAGEGLIAEQVLRPAQVCVDQQVQVHITAHSLFSASRHFSHCLMKRMLSKLRNLGPYQFKIVTQSLRMIIELT
jgi:hypothetical protein